MQGLSARLGSYVHICSYISLARCSTYFQEGLGDVVFESQAGKLHLCYKSTAIASGDDGFGGHLVIFSL